MGAITGSIAEAYYKNVPDHIKEEILKRLPEEFINVMEKFYKKFIMKNDDKFSDKNKSNQQIKDYLSDGVMARNLIKGIINLLNKEQDYDCYSICRYCIINCLADC